MVFSDVSGNLGIVQQVRAMMRVDSDQWATTNIVNSCNNWLDRVTGYAIGADRRFQFDDSNHSKLPIGTTSVVANQTRYSFLTDEQGNQILTLTGISLVDTNNLETPLIAIDRNSPEYDQTSFGVNSGTPQYYDKIADNVIQLDSKPTATDASTYTLKFYFQRTPSYFAATDTTKEPGCAHTIHRGFVIAAAYDGALTLGLPNLQPLSVELAKEEQKMKEYFANRNKDERTRMRVYQEEKWL